MVPVDSNQLAKLKRVILIIYNQNETGLILNMRG